MHNKFITIIIMKFLGKGFKILPLQCCSADCLQSVSRHELCYRSCIKNVYINYIILNDNIINIIMCK